MFDFLDKETLGLLDGGKDLEYKQLEEVKWHNLVINEQLTYKVKKENHEYTTMLLKDFMQLKMTEWKSLLLLRFSQIWYSLIIGKHLDCVFNI